MKTLVLSLVLLAANIVAAQAEDRRKCIRDVYELTGEMAAAKRLCDPKNRVTNPNEYGWICANGNGPERVKGSGFKQQRDVLCE